MEQNARANSQMKEQQRLDDLRGAVAGAMNTLDEQLRVILCLHYEQDIPCAKAAELLDENEGTLRANASRGIALLREKLSRAGYCVTPAIVAGALGAGLGVKSPAALSIEVEKNHSTAMAPTAKAADGGLTLKLALLARRSQHF